MLEDRTGRVIAVEIKAGATVRRGDLRGLERFRALAGERFVAGLVLCTTRQTTPLGDQHMGYSDRGSVDLTIGHGLDSTPESCSRDGAINPRWDERRGVAVGRTEVIARTVGRCGSLG